MYKLFLFCLLLSSLLRAQTPVIDSLRNAAAIIKNDTTGVNTLNELAYELSFENLQQADSFCRITIQLATWLNFYKGRSSAYNTLGNTLSDMGKQQAALDAYFLSVKDKLLIKDQKGLATVYSNIGIVYKQLSQKEKALQYYRKALQARIGMKDKKGIGDSYNNFGSLYRDAGQYDAAVYYHTKALQTRLQINDSVGVGYSYNNIGGIYIDNGDYEHGLSNLIASAVLFEKLNRTRLLVTVYSNIAESNIKIRDYKAALKYIKLAEDKALKGSFKNNLAYIYSVFGNIYADLNDAENAKKYYSESLSHALALGNTVEIAEAYSGLGVSYGIAGNRVAQDTCIGQAIRVARENKIMRALAGYLMNHAFFILRGNSSTGVLNSLSEADTILHGINSVSLKITLYEAYSRYYEFVAQPETALRFYKKYATLKDSLFNNDMAAKVQMMQIAFETEKKKAEITLLRQNEELDKVLIAGQQLQIQKRNYLLAGVPILVILLIIAGYLFFRKQKTEMVLAETLLVKKAQDNERLRIANDIHDELGSGLSKIRFLSEIIYNKPADALNNLASISETSNNLVENMRDLIWALNPDNTTLDNLIARIREYSTDYLGDFPVQLKSVFPDNVPPLQIQKETHRHIYLTVKEALNNIVKHAHATEAEITVSLDEQLHILIRDNGRGFRSGESTAGRGLKNMVYRIEMADGEIQIGSSPDGGTSLSITVLLNKMTSA